MKILVTGASGFIGKALCNALLEYGYLVRGVYRSYKKVNPKIESVFIDDINGDTNWDDALKEIDVVIHLAARVHVMKENLADPLAEFRKVNVDGTLNLAKHASATGVKRLIFLSSVKVNGEQTVTDKPFTESDIPFPLDAYGVSKYEAELGLLEIANNTNMEIVIIRPPLVYGVGVKANFAKLLQTVKKGVPLPLGNINNKRSLVYIDNLTSLILCCISHPNASNQILLVSDGNDISTSELLRVCAEALGVKSHLFFMPKKLIENIARLVGKKEIAERLLENLQVSITKANQLLGWKPPITLKEALTKTAQGFD